MGTLTIINLLLVLCAGIAYSSPCFEQHPPCVPHPHPPCGNPPPYPHPPCGNPPPYPHPPCGNPPPKHKDCHKDQSKEKKHHNECKEKDNKKKEKKKKSSSHEDVDISIDIDIDIHLYKEVFTECKYVDNSEAEVYIFWLNQCNSGLLKYIDILVQYLQVQEALKTEIVNYQIFQEKIYTIYEVLRKKNIYSAQVDLYSKTAIIEEVRVHIIEAMKGLSKQSVLYTSLNECLQKEITMIPLFIGLCRSIVMSQEVYYSHTTREISGHSKCEEEKEHHKECKEKKKKKEDSDSDEHHKKCKDKEKKKKHSEEDESHEKCKDKKKKKKKDKSSEEEEHHKKCKKDKKKKKEDSDEDEHHKKCKEKKEKKEKKKEKKHDDDSSSGERVNISVDIDIDINYYGDVFTNSQYVDNSEGEIYLNWMNKCSKEQLQYVDVFVNYLQTQKCLATEITDFSIFKEKIIFLYETFKSQHIFSTEVDLYSQKTVCEEAKVQIREAMEGLSTQSALYSSLNYFMQSETRTETQSESVMIPLAVGLCRSVVLSQESYFSQSSSSYTKTTMSH